MSINGKHLRDDKCVTFGRNKARRCQLIAVTARAPLHGLIHSCRCKQHTKQHLTGFPWHATQSDIVGAPFNVIVNRIQSLYISINTLRAVMLV